MSYVVCIGRKSSGRSAPLPDACSLSARGGGEGRLCIPAGLQPCKRRWKQSSNGNPGRPRPGAIAKLSSNCVSVSPPSAGQAATRTEFARDACSSLAPRAQRVCMQLTCTTNQKAGAATTRPGRQRRAPPLHLDPPRSHKRFPGPSPAVTAHQCTRSWRTWRCSASRGVPAPASRVRPRLPARSPEPNLKAYSA